MLYKICNNGRAVLITRAGAFVDEALTVSFDEIDEGYTAIFSLGSKKYYRKIAHGECALEKKHIEKGPIGISVLKDNETQPTYICDELYAVCRSREVCVSGNNLEYDRLLAEQRCEIDELRAYNAAFKAELQYFREEFERVYEGYKIL